MSAYQFFEVQVADGIATVTMNRPPVNVLNLPMVTELNALLEAVLSDTNLAAFVLRANGKAFSAGVDVADHAADKVGEMIRQFHGVCRKLLATDALTIAVVNGAALGGGCELALCCDIVLASERAKFGQPEVHLAVFPPVAACVLPAQVGIKKAIELNALGAVIEAPEAHRIGLVNQVFPVEGFDEHVQRFLDGVRKLSRPVVRLAKRTTAGAVRTQVLARLDEVERLYLNDLMQLKDVHEGLASFTEKRPPRWTHG